LVSAKVTQKMCAGTARAVQGSPLQQPLYKYSCFSLFVFFSLERKNAAQFPAYLNGFSHIQLLSISLRSLDYLIFSQELPARRIGRRVLVHRHSIEQFARRDHSSIRATAASSV
jgi:hypothetical protein